MKINDLENLLAVNCRIGSLEIHYIIVMFMGGVNCRIGSLEM